MEAPPTNARGRLSKLTALARAAYTRRDEDRLCRLHVLHAVGVHWLETHSRAVRRDLEERVAAIERVGAPPSLFTLMGLSRYEKPYNRVLAWIVHPEESHGAGRAALHGLAAVLDLPELAADAADPAATIEVRGERPWPDAAQSSREPDLLVLTPSMTLLVENKVLSEESGDDQYAAYLDALIRLSTARGTRWAAFLAAPSRRDVPEGAAGTWSGCVTHRELAAALRIAADEPTTSEWGRVACLLVSRQFEEPEGAASHHARARDVLRRAGSTPSVDDLANMRDLIGRLSVSVSPGRAP